MEKGSVIVTKSMLTLLDAWQTNESTEKVFRQGIWLYSESHLAEKIAD